jgi:predicted acyltransferase
MRTPRSEAEKTAWLMVAGALLLWLGELMNLALPINKSLWTSSYSVFMAGLAMLGFGVCYWLVDVKGYRKPVRPLAIYGMNAITVFVLSGVLGRLLSIKINVDSTPEQTVALQSFLFQNFFAPLASPTNASLLWAIMWTAMLYVVAYMMYRKRWFVRF